MNRRQFIQTAAALSVAASTRDLFAGTTLPTTKSATQPALPNNIAWHDAKQLGITVQAFQDTESPYDRLPARAKAVVREPVWKLSHHTAGMSVRFETNSTEIFLRYEVTNADLAMPHMPATGVSGVDLYTFVDKSWIYLNTLKPVVKSAAVRLAWDIVPAKRQYLLHLPLYNGVSSLAIGTLPTDVFTPIPPHNDKPIVWYGTSITQGGCASRPGMAFTNILARRLDRTILNFGFSGQGRMEPEVVNFLAEIEPALFIFDNVANTPAQGLADRTGPCVKIVRDKHPSAPILILEARNDPARASILQSVPHELGPKHKAQRAAYDKLVAEGLQNLHYRRGDDLLENDGEATVDGSHPNDLGMMRYADVLEPDLRKLLS